MKEINISVVIPFLNEDESLPELLAWIERVMLANQFSYEIILVDDGSTDNSWTVVEQHAQINPNIKGIKFRRNYGKSAALNVAFHKAVGNVVITMDADMQDSPDEIPELYRMIVEDNYDLVSGWKKKRYDPITKTIPTKLFNWATQRMSGIKLNDFNCGLKSYKLEVVKAIEVYNEMHRYIPVLAKWNGFRTVDNDGSYEYSKTIELRADGSINEEVVVAPNPFTNNLSININAVNSGAGKAELMDLNGKVLGTQDLNVEKGTNAITVQNAEQLKQGIYLLRVITNNGTQVFRIIKN